MHRISLRYFIDFFRLRYEKQKHKTIFNNQKKKNQQKAKKIGEFKNN